jgi:carboxymethylenebutenolidase
MSSQTLSIKTPDGAFSAYVARPVAAKAPAIVVIQEIFGVNAVMRQIADDLAAQGYIAICPDLFWRIEPGIDITDQSAAEWAKAFELYTAFNVDQGIADIAATITAIRNDAGCNGKVGAVGYCLGGLLSYLTAARTDIDAAVSYYGVGIDGKLDEAAKITAPLLLHIAEKDQFVPAPAQAAMAKVLVNGPRLALHTYAGCDHAFARPGGEHYDAAAAKLANDRTAAFFTKTLG